jgi:outer membrane receptor protein involved in Fe transport
LIQTNTNNRRHAFSQELRLQGAPNEFISYVVGGYFSNTRGLVGMRALTSERAFQQLSGTTILQRFGVPDTGYFSNILENTEDVETAAFADVTLNLSDNWRASLGVRATHVSTSFEQYNYGTNSHTTSAAQSRVSGEISDTPITPKASLQYFFSPDDLLYFSAAKGFRAGGVNQVTTSATTGALSRFGLTPAVFPTTYESDSVWNYELGAKFRLWDGKAQINTAVYDIEWKNVQAFYFTGDGAVFNVPEARSQGLEIEWQVRPITQLTLNGSAAYTKSEYLKGLSIPGGPGSVNGNLVIAVTGQKFAQPEYTYDLGARYDFTLGSSVNAYARIDYRWLDGYATAVPGTSQYSPDSSNIPSQKNLNLRLGAEFRDFDVSLVVLNLTDEDTGSSFGGRSACTNADCSTYNTYTYGRTVVAPMPRQIGIEFTYRPQ